MTIEFKSIITMNKDASTIKFKAPVEISNHDDMTVYEFDDPENKVHNRIEINDSKVNIFAGRASINLDMNEEIEIEYETPMGPIYMVTKTKSIHFDESKSKFEYELFKGGDIVGHYKITLTIKK